MISTSKPIYNGIFFIDNMNNEKKSEELRLVNYKKSFRITGNMVSIVKAIVKSLDGKHTLKEIAESLAITEEYIISTCKLLHKKGLLILDQSKNSLHFPKEEGKLLEGYLAAKQINSTDSMKNLSLILGRCIYVIGDKSMCHSLKEQLEPVFNVIIVDKFEEIVIEQCDLVISCNLFEDVKSLNEISKKCHEKRLEYLKLVINFNEVMVGPIFVPKNLCYECYLARIYANTPQERYVAEGETVIRDNIRTFYFPGSVELISAITKTQLIKYYSNVHYSDIVSNVYTLCLNDFTSQISPVLSLPNCVNCNTDIFELEEREVVSSEI